MHDEATPYVAIWRYLNLAIWNEVCRGNRGSAIQWEWAGKYQPYPVRPFTWFIKMGWQWLTLSSPLNEAICRGVCSECISADTGSAPRSNSRDTIVSFLLSIACIRGVHDKLSPLKSCFKKKILIVNWLGRPIINLAWYLVIIPMLIVQLLLNGKLPPKIDTWPLYQLTLIQLWKKYSHM